MCFYVYVSIYSNKPKSFRVKVVLSAAVLAHIVQLLQTVFPLVMEFLEYHGIYVLMGDIMEFYHCITLLNIAEYIFQLSLLS